MRNLRKPYRIQQKRYWWKNKFLWFSLLGILVIALFIYVLWFFPILQVKEIRILGDDSIVKDRVEAITKEKIAQNILGLHSMSILFINENAVSNVLQERFPSIESASIKRSFPSTITVTISLRQEIVSWCRFINESGACVGVDKFGIAFMAASSVDFYITGPPELTEVSWGDQVFKPDLLTQLIDFKAEAESWGILKNDDVKIKEMAIVSENRIHAVSSEGWQAYINPKEQIDWQLTKLKLVLESEVPKERRIELLYLDLRFGDQAFVKYLE